MRKKKLKKNQKQFFFFFFLLYLNLFYINNGVWKLEKYSNPNQTKPNNLCSSFHSLSSSVLPLSHTHRMNRAHNRFINGASEFLLSLPISVFPLHNLEAFP